MKYYKEQLEHTESKTIIKEYKKEETLKVVEQLKDTKNEEKVSFDIKIVEFMKGMALKCELLPPSDRLKYLNKIIELNEKYSKYIKSEVDYNYSEDIVLTQSYIDKNKTIEEIFQLNREIERLLEKIEEEKEATQKSDDLSDYLNSQIDKTQSSLRLTKGGK